MERELRNDLERLRRELHAGPELDADSRAQLTALVEEIEVALGSGGGDETFGDRLRAATERFEESHPALTELVGRVAAALASMGI